MTMSNDAEVRARKVLGDEWVADWLRGDWYEKWQDATEDADSGLMATLEALRGRVENTIFAAFAAEARSHDGEWEAMRERAATMLTDRAALLRTPGGRVKAQWHENDAEMVAGELDRQAKAIRSLSAVPLFEGGAK